MSELDLSFLKNIDDLDMQEQAEFSVEESLMQMADMNEAMKRKVDDCYKYVNERLATGNCFLKDDILYERKRDRDQELYYFKGNALEHKVEKGTLDKSILDHKNKLQALIARDLSKIKFRKVYRRIK